MFKQIISKRLVSYTAGAVGYLQNTQSIPRSTTVPHGNACVDPYAHATVFTKLHTTKNGTDTKNTPL